MITISYNLAIIAGSAGNASIGWWYGVSF